MTGLGPAGGLPSGAPVHTRFWQTSDFVAVVALAAAIALELVVPLPIESWIWRPALWAAGGVYAVAGVAVIVAARLELKRHDQPSAPGKPTNRLVTTRIFAFTRNPTYLGLLLVLTGVGASGLLPWLLVLLPLIAGWLHIMLVVPEEAYLLGTFGDAYARYRECTPRWIGPRTNTGGRH